MSHDKVNADLLKDMWLLAEDDVDTKRKKVQMAL